MAPVQTSHPTPDELAAFGLGKLDPEESAAIERHITQCGSCCQLLKEIPDDTLVGLLRDNDTRSEFGDVEGGQGRGTAAAETAFRSSRNDNDQVDACEAESSVLDSADSEEPGSASVVGDIPEQLANHPRYHVERLLGKGGMGDVYQAQHRLMERTVAIKVINPEIVQRPEAVQRFQREVKAAARLSHPNIVAAYDAEEAGDLHILVMEYVEGRDLACVVKDSGPLSVADACQFVAQAARGLQHAHDCGMVHRDIKPQNLMLTPTGEVKILDFGLAQFAREAVVPGKPDDGPGELTDAHSMMGTPDYMAPEQAQSAHDADICADIYGLGATLYFLLAGKPPFAGDRVMEKLKRHAQDDPPPLAEVRDDVPSELEAVLRRMMDKDPAERYQTPDEVVEVLAPFAQPTPPVAQPRPRRRFVRPAVLVGLAAAAVLAFAGIFTVATNRGNLEIRTFDEDVQVSILKGGREVTIVDTKTDNKVTLYAGEYQLKLSGEKGDLQLSTDTFTLRRGDKVIVEVWRRPAVPASVPETSTDVAHLLVTLRGHEAEISEMVYSPAANMLASASFDGTLRIWDANTRELLGTLRGHTGKVWGVAFSPDGKTLASAAIDGKILLWDVTTRKLRSTFKENELPTDRTYDRNIAFSPDGKKLAAPSKDGVLINIWELKTGALLSCFRHREGNPTRFAFNPDGTRLAFGTTAGWLTLFDVESVKELWSIKADRRQVISIAFSPDGKTLATGNADHYVRLWDVDTGKLVSQLPYYHSSFVRCVAFSPDGKILASGRSLIKLWHVQSRRELATLEGNHGKFISSLAFHSDGRTLASSGLDGQIKLWDIQAATAGAARPFATLEGHTDDVCSVAFSPDGKTLATGSCDLTAKLWDLPSGKERATLRGHSARLLPGQRQVHPAVRWVAFSPDGKTLATAGKDGVIKLWDVTSGKELSTLKGHVGAILCVDFAPDGKTLASVGPDRIARVWDVATGTTLATLEGHTDGLECVAFAPDGETLATGGWDQGVKLWDVATWKEREGLGLHPDCVFCVAFSADGKTLATGCKDNIVRLWDLATRKVRHVLAGHTGFVRCVAFSPDGKTLASSSDDDTVKLWDVSSGRMLATLSGHRNTRSVWSVAFSPDGRTLASASSDETVKLWDVSAWTARPSPTATLSGHTDDVRSVAFSPDGKTLATASFDLTAKLWDLPSGKERVTLRGHSPTDKGRHGGGVNSVAFSPDGRILATAGLEGLIKLWNTATGKPVATFEGHAERVLSVAFAPDGKTIASASYDKTARVWEVATGKTLLILEGHTLAVECVAFAPDGKTLATGSWDNSVKLWDTATWKPRTTLRGHTESVYSLAFSPDGNTLATGSRDYSIRLWNVATGDPLRVLEGHTGYVWGVAFTPDGKTLASASRDGTVRLWDAATGKSLTAFRAHTSWVRSVAFSPDGRTLASASRDRTVKLWDVSQWTSPPPVTARAVEFEELLVRLKHGDSQVRAEAAMKLGELGDKRAIEPLIATLRDEDRSVRGAAASALGKIGGSEAEEAIPELINILKHEVEDKKGQLKLAAAEALGEIGPAAVPELRRLLRDGNSIVKMLAAGALAKMGPKAREAMPELIKALGDEYKYTSSSAAAALGAIGPAAIPELKRVLTDEDEQIRALAADALGGIGAPAVPVLIEALADQHGVVRGRAAIALTQIGPAAKDAIPALEKMLNDEASFPRQMAAEALERIRMKP